MANYAATVIQVKIETIRAEIENQKDTIDKIECEMERKRARLVDLEDGKARLK